MPLIYDLKEGPIEIAKGRGDLRYSSAPFNLNPQHLVLVGRTVSYAELFCTQVWIATAVMRMLTWSIRVPLKLYRRVDESNKERVNPTEHPLAASIEHPGPRRSRAHLVMDMLGPLLVHGNSLTELENGARDTIRFTPRDFRFARPIQVFRNTISGWEVDNDDEHTRRTVAADQILHLAWWSPLGPIGVSPLQQLGVTIAIEDAAQRYQRSLFANGARPPSAVTASSDFLTFKEPERTQVLNQLREDLDKYIGPDAAGRPPLLPPGLDWKPVGHSAVEAALIDQRKITRNEIAAVYQIPPPMIGQLDKATFSNIETQRQMAYTDGLGPPLVLIEQTFNAHVIRDLLRIDDMFVEFDFGGVLRGDRLAEIRALREAINSALMTPNEGRGKLNLNRVDEPEADQLWIPANNLRPLGGRRDEPAAPPTDDDQPDEGQEDDE